MMLYGREARFCTQLGRFERVYIGLLGLPILGARVRARNVLAAAACIPAPGPARLLDVGSSWGSLLFALARRFPRAQCVGIEIDPEAIRAAQDSARMVGPERFEFIEGDVNAMDGQEAFDLITMVDVLEHVEDDEALLRRVRAALRPGGQLIVHVPARSRRYPVFRWSENFPDIEGHFRVGYDPAQLRARLEQAGLEVLDLYHSYGFWENLANNISYFVTGAKRRNRGLYAFVFPLLMLMAWLGRSERPRRGAGLLAIGRRAV